MVQIGTSRIRKNDRKGTVSIVSRLTGEQGNTITETVTMSANRFAYLIIHVSHFPGQKPAYPIAASAN